jgi:hypothetical protein
MPRWSLILRRLREIVLGAALAVLAWNFVCTPLRLSSGGPIGWRIVDRLSYRLREPRMGERVAFRQPERPQRIRIGRIAGLPMQPLSGETGRAIPPAHYSISLDAAGEAGHGRLLGPIPRLYILGPIWP